MNPTLPQSMPDFVSRRVSMHAVTALLELMRLGVDITRVDVLAVGEYENYRGEICWQSPPPGTEIGPDSKIVLEVGYPSAVDEIPYQFFYGLGDTTADRSGWEERARHLMAPFDAAVVRYRVWSQYHILKLNFGYLDRAQVEKFIDTFGVTLPAVDLDQSELLLLASLLPALHAWGGNAEAVAWVIRLFFGFECEIVENTPGRYDIPAELQYHLGGFGGRLGRQTVLGRSFVECDSAYRVVLGGVKPQQVRGLLPGQRQREKLEWLLKLAMPGNLVYRLALRPVVPGLVLGREDGGSYLGYATRLQEAKQ